MSGWNFALESIIQKGNTHDAFDVVNIMDINKKYFTNFDIKNIIKANIDYTISNDFFVSDIDRYVMEGKILLLQKKTAFLLRKDYNKMFLIGKELIDYVEEVK